MTRETPSCSGKKWGSYVENDATGEKIMIETRRGHLRDDPAGEEDEG